MLSGRKSNQGRVKISIKHKYSMKNSDTDKEREKKVELMYFMEEMNY